MSKGSVKYKRCRLVAGSDRSSVSGWAGRSVCIILSKSDTIFIYDIRSQLVYMFKRKEHFLPVGMRCFECLGSWSGG